MQENTPTLFIEINKDEFSFSVGKNNEDDFFELLHLETLHINGIENNKITDFENLNITIKKILYSIEQKLKFTFKELVLILNNFNFYFINVSGFKNLNGSQLIRENVTYIINSIKSNIDNFEKDKKIIHIFNSKFLLDKKNIENLPIGLFGDFYSHELSFALINKNDYKNLHNIFSNCNLRIKKIVSKSFVEGVHLIDENKDLNSFIKIEINENDSKIILFENSSLKFVQEFEFGTRLIINDICKVVSLKKESIEKLISVSNLHSNLNEDEIVEKEYFENTNYRKIKKKLIYEIANARIQEIADIILIDNINFNRFSKKKLPIFLKIKDDNNRKCFNESYKTCFSDDYLIVNFDLDVSPKELIKSANKVVQFGWSKEAVPIITPKKSIIRRFLDILFT